MSFLFLGFYWLFFVPASRWLLYHSTDMCLGGVWGFRNTHKLENIFSCSVTMLRHPPHIPHQRENIFKLSIHICFISLRFLYFGCKFFWGTIIWFFFSLSGRLNHCFQEWFPGPSNFCDSSWEGPFPLLIAFCPILLFCFL